LALDLAVALALDLAVVLALELVLELDFRNSNPPLLDNCRIYYSAYLNIADSLKIENR